MLKALLMARTSNLGDDIQAWPAWKFWGGVDAVVERDTFEWWYPPGFRPGREQRVAVIANGWYTHNPDRWFPPPNLVPLFISVHVAPEVASRLLRPEVVEYLSQFEIGARDLQTLELLESFGLKAYFSGCLTLTVSHWLPRTNPPEQFRPLIIDMDSEALPFVPEEILEQATSLTQELSHGAEALIRARGRIARTSVGIAVKKLVPRPLIDKAWLQILGSLVPKKPMGRLVLAEKRLEAFASASLILTSRLHVALPAASLGVPVILVHPKLREDPRFRGLSDLVNSYSTEEFRDIGQNLPYDKMSNPNMDKLQYLRQKLLERLHAFRNLTVSISPG